MKSRHKPAEEGRRLEVDLSALHTIVARSGEGALSAEEREQLKGAVETLAFLTRELESKSTSLERLRRFLFGGSEKTSKVLGQPPAAPPETEDEAPPEKDANEEKRKRKGHGRNGAAQFPGAKKVTVPHGTLQRGAPCPGCACGKVYPLQEPHRLLRITGMAPLDATVYECERLRCGSCGEVFGAPAPDGVGEERYDASATAMVGLLKYGTGLPFHRLERLQQGMGMPLPAATQWDLVRKAADTLAPVHRELVHQGADGEVLHNDDTAARVLGLTEEQRQEALGDDVDGRTGVFTSSIVSTHQGAHPVALFFTGPRHAGENIAELLLQRDAQLPAPIQMCDALAANTSRDFDTIVAACIAHGRRHFVEVAESFPAECRFVLETLRDVFKYDAQAKARGLSPEERLHLHQQQSGPLMDGLETWMREQFEQRKVEPNSGLGDAIRYMQKHWEKLTLFLRKAGAPLDNNICERALKRAILHRKNSLFFKTLNGARVADLFMSLIHTAELNDVAPFDYLVALLRNSAQAAASPASWMPWNYPPHSTPGPAPP